MKNLPFYMMVAGAIVYAIVLSGCSYCNAVANKSTIECKMLNEVETCGPSATAVLSYLIVEMATDGYAAAIADLEARFPSLAQCVEAVWDQQIAAKYGKDSPQLKAYRNALKVQHAKRAERESWFGNGWAEDAITLQRIRLLEAFSGL